jgi:hypothetical protein
LSKRRSSLAANISATPTSVVVSDAEDLASIGAWASRDVDGKLTIVIPRDIESYADDPMTLLACAIVDSMADKCTCVEAHVGTGYKTLDKKSQKAACQWALGAAAFFRHRSGSPPSSKGSWAKGWHFAANYAIRSENLDAWLLKGKSMHLTQALTGKAWSTDVHPIFKRIESLIRVTAPMVGYKPTVRHWLVPYNNLKGTHIKKAFFNTREGLLSIAEISSLNAAFSTQLKAYNDLEAVYNEINSFTELKAFPSLVSGRARDLRPLEALYDKVVRARITLVTPANKKEQKREAKRPMTERIADLDIREYYNTLQFQVSCGRKYHPIKRHLEEPLPSFYERLDSDITDWCKRLPIPDILQEVCQEQLKTHPWE